MAKRKRRTRRKKTPQETLSKILAGFVGLLCLGSFLISWYNQYGGLPDWGAIYEMVHNGWTYEQYLDQVRDGAVRPQKTTFWQRLAGRR